MLPAQTAGTARASVAINPIKAIGAMKSRHLVIAFASPGVFGLNAFQLALLGEQVFASSKHGRRHNDNTQELPPRLIVDDEPPFAIHLSHLKWVNSMATSPL